MAARPMSALAGTPVRLGWHSHGHSLGESWGFLGILGDSWGFLGILVRDFMGFLRILADSLGFYGILGDSW